MLPDSPTLRASKKARIASSSILRLSAATTPCTYSLVGLAFICICSMLSNGTALSKWRGYTQGRVWVGSAKTISSYRPVRSSASKASMRLTTVADLPTAVMGENVEATRGAICCDRSSTAEAYCWE